MPFTIPWSALLKYGLPLLFAVFIIHRVVSYWINEGEENIQAKWDAAEKAYTKDIDALKVEINARERNHRTKANEISSRLAEAETKYAAELAGLRGSYTLRVRESTDRAKTYERMSESGATERANLASYAAQLDRSLVEGRQVVGELRSTLIQRDQQLIEVGKQLQADRELIGVQ